VSIVHIHETPQFRARPWLVRSAIPTEPVRITSCADGRTCQSRRTSWTSLSAALQPTDRSQILAELGPLNPVRQVQFVPGGCSCRQERTLPLNRRAPRHRRVFVSALQTTTQREAPCDNPWDDKPPSSRLGGGGGGAFELPESPSDCQPANVGLSPLVKLVGQHRFCRGAAQTNSYQCKRNWKTALRFG